MILPFIDKAPIIKVTDYNGEKIANFYSIEPKDYKLPVLPLYHVLPLNINILEGSNEQIATTLQKGPSKVIHVDYEQVAKLIQMNNNECFYPCTNGWIKESTDFQSLIVLASNGSRFELTESLFEDLSKLKSLKKSNLVIQQTQSSIYQRLEDYLKSGYVTQRTLLLLGQSGVSKSALVKSIADKLGFRVQDMRLAYSSRLDIQGLTEITYENGLPLSSESPSDELIKCTDEYINYCRNALPIIKERALALKKENAPEEKIQQLRNLYKQYQYYAKPPILFLDEVKFY